MIRLAAGDWTAALRPDVGGAISRLTLAGRDVLRPMPEASTDPLDAASFPLVPFANRIDRGRFVFAGQSVDLGITPGFAPHALHGDGWRRPWALERIDEATALMSLDHAPGAWPWRWRAEQDFALDEGGLTVDLGLSNLDRRPMPAGLGHHPFFPASAEARLSVGARAVWQVDRALIPTRLAPAAEVGDWSGGRLVDRREPVDHCYVAWDGIAVLENGELVTRVIAKAANRLHVYIPPEESYLCLEPVSHRPDALNAPVAEDTGLATLQPGETLRLRMRIEAELKS